MPKKFLGILVILAVLVLGAEIVYVSKQNQKPQVELEETRPILVWYTDPDIQTYMEETAAQAAAAYGVEIQTELVSDVDYIENISEKSIAETMSGPDLYITSSSLLEKAALAGLTTTLDGSRFADSYGEKAFHAVTYGGKVIAKPFYIDTSFLVYNKNVTDQIPETIDDILTYAENFEMDDTTADVETIFEWNVADVLENFMFMGAYTNLGGDDGDDKSQVSLDLDKIGECMAYYQNLNSFFAIDADTISSQDIMQKFVDGKTVYAVVNVPMLAQIDKAVDSDFYGTAALPDLTPDLQARGLSVTNSIVVNPYSVNVSAAEAIASYMTENAAGSLYEMAGKLPAYRKLSEAPTPAWQTVCEAYDEAQETPKIMELSDMWLNLEVTLADIWRGEDASGKMQAFSELLSTRLD